MSHSATDGINCTFYFAALASDPVDISPFLLPELQNLSDIVAACLVPVCGILMGGGNPDLGGIGVIASYILQFALAMLYGPCLVIALVLWPMVKSRWRRRQRNEAADSGERGPGHDNDIIGPPSAEDSHMRTAPGNSDRVGAGEASPEPTVAPLPVVTVGRGPADATSDQVADATVALHADHSDNDCSGSGGGSVSILSGRLAQSYPIVLWTSLIFSLAITLGCTVRRQSRHAGYEAGAIGLVVVLTTNTTTLLLVCSLHSVPSPSQTTGRRTHVRPPQPHPDKPGRRIDGDTSAFTHPKTFGVLFAADVALALWLLARRPPLLESLWPVVLACYSAVTARPELQADPVVHWLWNPRWVDSQRSLLTIDLVVVVAGLAGVGWLWYISARREQSALSSPAPLLRAVALTLALLAVFILSSFCCYIVAASLLNRATSRRAWSAILNISGPEDPRLLLGYEGPGIAKLSTTPFADEDEWGIGQILAPFAWLGVLLELGWAVSEGVREVRRRGKAAADGGRVGDRSGRG